MIVEQGWSVFMAVWLLWGGVTFIGLVREVYLFIVWKREKSRQQ